MDKIHINTNTNIKTNNLELIEPDSDLDTTLTRLRNSSSSGIKFLLNIRNLKSEDLENDEFVKENKKLIMQQEENYNQISDEDYKKNIDEMDNLIKDIMNTKQGIKMQKIKETVKTREDMLNFYDIKDYKNYNYAPEPIQSNLNYLKNVTNTKRNEFQKKNLDYKNIKEILNTQNNIIKDLDLIEDNEKEQNSFTIKQSFFPTSLSENINAGNFNNKKGNKDKKYNNKDLATNSSSDISVSTMNASDYCANIDNNSKQFKFKNPLMNKNSYNLTEEEKEFMNKYVYNNYDSDDLMGEIDSCIKIGEEIDDYINYVEN